MRKVFLFLIIVIAGITTTYGQQEPQFTQNMFNKLGVNPGFAGIKKAICADMIFRQQWMGFTETVNGHKNDVAPQTMLFSLHSDLRAIHGGLGLVIYKDKLGYEDNIGVKFGYSFHQPIQGGYLGVGLMAGFLNKKIDFSHFNPIDDQDPFLQSVAVESDMIFDLSFGAYYYNPGLFYAGLSSSQLMESQSSIGVDLASPQLKRHYYIMGGYQWNIPNNSDLELRPNLFIKTDFASWIYDINALMYYRSQFWGGLSYRLQDAVAILIGAQPFLNSGNKGLETLKIGYSYDITTSALGSNGKSSGSHEAFLGYCFKIVIPDIPSSYRNVRFL